MISSVTVLAMVSNITAALRGNRAIVMILVLLAGAGCVRTSALQDTQAPVEKLSRKQMLGILERTYTQVNLQALAEVELQRGDDRQSSTQALHVQTPYHLRAEVYNFMGQLLVMLAANGADLEAYVPSRNVIYFGMVTRKRMERFAYVPLMPADMVALLLQRLPPGVLQLAQVQKGESNSLRFNLSARQEYVVDFGAEQVKRIAYYELGREVFSIAYADAAPVHNGESMFPASMTLKMPSQDLTLDIKLEDVRLNPGIDPALFKIEGRSGVKTVPLEDL